jgi:hypothetical protein
VQCVKFDFEDEATFDSALSNIDIIFLLRPPFISEKGIKKIVFLSVQGAEKNTLIPHRKIELLILKSMFTT